MSGLKGESRGRDWEGGGVGRLMHEDMYDTVQRDLGQGTELRKRIRYEGRILLDLACRGDKPDN